MAYASWSVVFGEQPSAAKWNILGTNDSSFNDGTGIAVDVITDAKLIYGKLRSRQGGSATNWSTTGTTNYDYSATNVFDQIGSALSSDNTTTLVNGWFVTSIQTVTFPTAYSRVPQVFLTTTSGHAVASLEAAASTTAFTWRGRANTSIAASVQVQWIAVGE